MTVAGLRSERFDMGRVVSWTFGAIGRNRASFGLFALIMAGAPRLLIGLWTALMAPQFGQTGAVLRSGAAGSSIFTLLSAIVNLVFLGILQAGIVHGVVSDLNGRRSTLPELFGVGARFARTAIFISVIYGVVTSLGLVLLLVPGLMIATTWLVALPVGVVEATGVMSAFGRSGELTKGHRWSLLGLILVYLLAAALIQAAIMALGAAFVHPAGQGSMISLLPLLIVEALIAAATNLIVAVGVSAVYYELRSRREGISPANLAAVFD